MGHYKLDDKDYLKFSSVGFICRCKNNYRNGIGEAGQRTLLTSLKSISSFTLIVLLYLLSVDTFLDQL